MQCILNDLVKSTRSTKEKFHLLLSTKLFHPSTSAKTCLSILKIFVNGNKVPLISSVLVKGKFLTNFLEKAKIFNNFNDLIVSYFYDFNNARQYQTIVFFREYRLITQITDEMGISFKYEKILKVFQSLDTSKIHDHDGVSVRMLKISCPLS